MYCSVILPRITNPCIVGQYMKRSDKIERQGTGVHYSNDGTEFSGVWVDDRMNGEGAVLLCDSKINRMFLQVP